MSSRSNQRWEDWSQDRSAAKNASWEISPGCRPKIGWRSRKRRQSSATKAVLPVPDGAAKRLIDAPGRIGGSGSGG